MFGQLFGWSILAFFTYRSSFLDIFKTDIDLKQYWKNNFLCLISFGLSIILGKNLILLCHKMYFILNAILYAFSKEKKNNRNKRKNSRLFPSTPNIFVL